jgi:hypothetical protein
VVVRVVILYGILTQKMVLQILAVVEVADDLM